MPSLRSLSLVLSCLLLSCSTSPDTPEPPVTDHELLAEAGDSSRKEITETKIEYEMPDSAALLAYAVDTTGLPPEPQTKVKILLEGLFHKEEVWQGVEKKQWMGLYDENGSYALRPAALEVKPAFDPVADAKTEITTGRKVISGREVRGSEENVMLFISGLTKPKTGRVDTASFSRTTLRPGKEMLLTFRNKQYRLHAFGDSVQLQNGEYGYRNYGWKIAGSKNKRKIEQELAQDEILEGAIYQLHWAGDIDRDGIPDLIAGLSNHYSLTRTALFLSSHAAKGKLYKKVAVFESSGR